MHAIGKSSAGGILGMAHDVLGAQQLELQGGALLLLSQIVGDRYAYIFEIILGNMYTYIYIYIHTFT